MSGEEVVSPLGNGGSSGFSSSSGRSSFLLSIGSNSSPSSGIPSYENVPSGNVENIGASVVKFP
jgi:hypothetical protein